MGCGGCMGCHGLTLDEKKARQKIEGKLEEDEDMEDER